MTIELETNTPDSPSHKRSAEAELESLLLERLAGDLSVELILKTFAPSWLSA
jgi:hypothetical protein